MPPLVTICARKNSKRLPGKNTRLMHGKPLFLWTFDVARKLVWGEITWGEPRFPVVVSSDDQGVLASAKFAYQFSVIKRPEHLDDVGKMAQIRDAVTIMEHRIGMKYDPIVDLDITNPMKDVKDIENALDLFYKTPDCCSVVSVTCARKLPYYNQVPILNVPKAETYDMNAAVYVYSRDFLMENDHPVKEKTALYQMPEWTFCDIDTELDWKLVEFLMKEYGYVEKAQNQA